MKTLSESGDPARPSEQTSLPATDAILKQLDPLFSFALNLVRDRHSAEDLVQDTIVKALRNLDSLQAREKIQGWLFAILYRTFLNSYHRRRRLVSFQQLDSEDARLTSSAADSNIEERLIREAQDAEVRAAVAELEPEIRAAVWLHDVLEMRHRTIATILDCPMGTVASRIHRGHRTLRVSLRRHAAERGLG
jgi:RNA polymerase sigma-70 factor (ECF subfamily)